METLKIKNTYGIDLAATFECGQCFRFNRVADSKYKTEYTGVAHGKLLRIADDGEFLYLNATNEEFTSVWLDFLGLKENYGNIHSEILAKSNNKALHRAIEKGSGIRILKQDPWETVCSFIISQNNNIPRIKGLVETLSRAAGEEISDGIYSFPTPEAVMSLGEDGLRALKVGFRAPYIYDAAKKFADCTIKADEILALPTDEAAKLLCSIKGIGPKVAACALLFGFSKYDAFPIDVWMKRVLKEHFSSDFDPQSLGKYAGIAQQVLFYSIREEQVTR